MLGTYLYIRHIRHARARTYCAGVVGQKRAGRAPWHGMAGSRGERGEEEGWRGPWGLLSVPLTDCLGSMKFPFLMPTEDTTASGPSGVCAGIVSAGVPLVFRRDCGRLTGSTG